MKKTTWYIGATLIAVGCTALIAAAAEYAILGIAGFLLNDGYRGYQIPGFNLSFKALWTMCFAIGAWISCRTVLHVCRSAVRKERRLLAAEYEEFESQIMNSFAR